MKNMIIAAALTLAICFVGPKFTATSLASLHESDLNYEVLSVDHIETSIPLVTQVMSARSLISEYEEEGEDHENIKIEEALLAGASVMENVTVFAYASETGITATGMFAAPNVTIAVDPAVIPYDSDVLIDWGDGNLHYYRAADYHPDAGVSSIGICVATSEEAAHLGTKTVTIYVIPPC